ncbi:MAG TPA: hypothetical protein VMZ92_04925 [Planctomycetota bacterium]|nr:hypothetical protein [Planctomycetota bacterium]
MRKLLATIPVLILLVGVAAGQGKGVRFAAVNVYLDSGEESLAAYQLELAAEVGDVKIVGIEGGEHAAFKEPPYYDPSAISRDKVILAAFTTGEQLPKGKTRIARIHVQISGDAPPQYAVKLNVAASTEGRKISAKVSVTPQGETQ